MKREWTGSAEKERFAEERLGKKVKTTREFTYICDRVSASRECEAVMSTRARYRCALGNVASKDVASKEASSKAVIQKVG